MALPATLQQTSLSNLQQMAGHVSECQAALASEKVRMLLALKSSSHYFQRTSAALSHQGSQESKFYRLTSVSYIAKKPHSPDFRSSLSQSLNTLHPPCTGLSFLERYVCQSHHVTRSDFSLQIISLCLSNARSCWEPINDCTTNAQKTPRQMGTGFPSWQAALHIA